MGVGALAKQCNERGWMEVRQPHSGARHSTTQRAAPTSTSLFFRAPRCACSSLLSVSSGTCGVGRGGAGAGGGRWERATTGTNTEFHAGSTDLLRLGLAPSFIASVAETCSFLLAPHDAHIA